jgi:hypothetical protein
MAAGRKTGGGSRKGKPNRVTADIKAMILGALQAKGGQKYLERCADANPTAFLTLVGKVLPLQLTGGDSGDLPVVFNVVTGARECRIDIETGVSPAGSDKAPSPTIVDAEPVASGQGAAAPPLLPASVAPPFPVPDSAASMIRHPSLSVIQNPDRERWRL